MSFHRATTFLSLCFVLVAAACGAGSPMEEVDLAGTGGPDGGRCAPGDTQSCICLGGGEGTQTCRASGASYGPCAGCGGSQLPDGLVIADMGGGSACGNCDGCCDGATCIPFNSETNAKCGGRGQTCTACAGTKVCAAGTGMCVDSTGACGACTNGCCQNNVCLLDQPAACGAACTKCSYGVTCAAGACTTQIDQNAYFKVVVNSAKVLVNTTTCKDNWDFIGEPDPYVCVAYQSGGTLYQGCNTSNYVDGNLSPTWTATTGLMTAGGTPFLVPATVITSGKMQIQFYDYDSCVNGCVDDLMAQGTFPAKTTLDASYSTGMFGCAMNITFQLQ